MREPVAEWMRVRKGRIRLRSSKSTSASLIETSTISYGKGGFVVSAGASAESAERFTCWSRVMATRTNGLTTSMLRIRARSGAIVTRIPWNRVDSQAINRPPSGVITSSPSMVAIPSKVVAGLPGCIRSLPLTEARPAVSAIGGDSPKYGWARESSSPASARSRSVVNGSRVMPPLMTKVVFGPALALAWTPIRAAGSVRMESSRPVIAERSSMVAGRTVRSTRWAPPSAISSAASMPLHGGPLSTGAESLDCSASRIGIQSIVESASRVAATHG